MTTRKEEIPPSSALQRAADDLCTMLKTAFRVTFATLAAVLLVHYLQGYLQPSNSLAMRCDTTTTTDAYGFPSDPELLSRLERRCNCSVVKMLKCASEHDTKTRVLVPLSDIRIDNAYANDKSSLWAYSTLVALTVEANSQLYLNLQSSDEQIIKSPRTHHSDTNDTIIPYVTDKEIVYSFDRGCMDMYNMAWNHRRSLFNTNDRGSFFQLSRHPHTGQLRCTHFYYYDGTVVYVLSCLFFAMTALSSFMFVLYLIVLSLKKLEKLRTRLLP